MFGCCSCPKANKNSDNSRTLAMLLRCITELKSANETQACSGVRTAAQIVRPLSGVACRTTACIAFQTSSRQRPKARFTEYLTIYRKNYLQCFDAVGWAAGMASNLYKTEWWGAGVVICLEQGADLHVAQLMPLPLTVSCFSKIQIGFTFLVPAHLGSPGKRAVKRVCMCVCVLVSEADIDVVL